MAYTDSFTDTNGVDLEVHDNRWVPVEDANVFEIQSNQCSFIADKANGLGYLFNVTVASKHYSKCKIIELAGMGPAIRMSAGNFYFCWPFGGDKVYNGEWISSVGTDWDSGLTLPGVGDIAELTVDASTETTIIYKVNGSTVQTYNDKDGLSGGKYGLANYYAAGIVDDWEGGDVGSSDYTVSVSDSITLTDTPTLGGVPNISVSQSITVTDTPTMEGVPNVSVSDAISVTDTPTVLLPELDTYYISVNETVNVTDAPTLGGVPNISVTESITVADTPTVTLAGDLNISVSESITVSENEFYGWVELEVIVSETITVTDLPAFNGVPNISVSDSITVTDTPTVQKEGEEPPTELSIAITPDSVWAVGVRIYP